ncbi:MAG: M48 family metallopeptidase [Thermoanaerobaculia bacterium]
MSTRPSLAGRAVLALVLMFGFYVLAIGLAMFLLWIPYAEFVYVGRLHIKLAIGCVVGAGVILWSMLPRIDKFEAPGPLLTEQEHPKLFRTLREIASSTSQEMPSEVYAVPEVNAWVTQRGGIMGFGSRRVMGLGLPLLETVTVDQLRAILVHEFGHYFGGDTKLGPWIYKTRSALFRTFYALADAGSIMRKPFEWYGKLFLRITEAISRRQELVADELAAKTVGPTALGDGLIAIHRAGLAYDIYWRDEVSPVLNAGFRPAVSAGYAHFAAAEAISESLDKYIEEQIRNPESDPYDSHPPLAERLAALKRITIAKPATASVDEPAISLIANPDALERKILAGITREGELGEMNTIRWSDVGEKVWVPQWKKQVSHFAQDFSTLTIGKVATLGDNFDTLGNIPELKGTPAPEKKSIVAGALGSAIALSLARKGWSVEALPGDAIRVRGEGQVFEPFLMTQEIAEGKNVEKWVAACQSAGIADVALVVD